MEYMYVSLKLQNDYSSNLSKIAVMSDLPFLLFLFPASNKFLRVKKRVMLKLVIFTTESEHYWSSFSLNEW